MAVNSPNLWQQQRARPRGVRPPHGMIGSVAGTQWNTVYDPQVIPGAPQQAAPAYQPQWETTATRPTAPSVPQAPFGQPQAASPPTSVPRSPTGATAEQALQGYQQRQQVTRWLQNQDVTNQSRMAGEPIPGAGRAVPGSRPSLYPPGMRPNTLGQQIGNLTLPAMLAYGFYDTGRQLYDWGQQNPVLEEQQQDLSPLDSFAEVRGPSGINMASPVPQGQQPSPYDPQAFARPAQPMTQPAWMPQQAQPASQVPGAAQPPRQPAAPYVPNAADFPDPYANATAIPSRPQLPGGAGYSANMGARQTNQRGQQQAMDQMVAAQQGAAENGFSPQVEAQYAQPVAQGEADFWGSPEGQRRALTRTQNANNLMAMQPAGTRQMIGGASGSQFNTPEEWVAAGMPQSEGWTPESRLGLARSGMTTQQFQRELERDPQMRMAAFADAARQRELQAQQQEQDLASRAAWATQRMQERQAARASATPEQQRAAYMAQAPRVQQVDGKWQTEGRLGTTGDATKFAAHQQRQKEVRQQRGAGSIPDMDVRKEMLLAKRQGRQISPFEAGINVKVQRGEDLSDNEKLLAFGPGAMPLTQAAQQASAQTTAANVLSSLIEGGVPMVDPKTGMWNPMIGTLLSMAYPNANFMPFPNPPAPEAQPDKPPPKPEPPSPGDLAYSRTLTRPGGRTKPKGPPTVPWTGTAF